MIVTLLKITLKNMMKKMTMNNIFILQIKMPTSALNHL